MDINYKKFPKLKNAKLVAKNKEEFLGPDESIRSWIEHCCKISSINNNKTMIWGSVKPPAVIFVTGDIKSGSKKMSIVNHLLEIGKITENKSSKTLGWIMRTDSGVVYFVPKWTEEKYSPLAFFK